LWAAYNAAFSGPHGEIVLLDLVGRHFVVSDPFVPGCPEQTAHNLGEREVVLRMMGILKMDHRAIIKIMQEKQVARYV
jgi:hypothetical protein